MKFIWTDIETTGLRAQQDLILSVGFVITDEKLKEIARREWVIHHSDELLSEVKVEMEPFVIEMHTKNKLFDRVKHSTTDFGVVVHEACEFLDLHLGKPDEAIKNRPVMAGNSVAFDREFIRENMPELHMRFNYRLLDVSSFKVLAMATMPGAKAWNDSRPEAAHTPLADIEGSIMELQHWVNLFRTYEEELFRVA